jgi:hypothetical protein
VLNSKKNKKKVGISSNLQSVKDYLLILSNYLKNCLEKEETKNIMEKINKSLGPTDK